jgi:hypothetical protein
MSQWRIYIDKGLLILGRDKTPGQFVDEPQREQDQSFGVRALESLVPTPVRFIGTNGQSWLLVRDLIPWEFGL